MSTIDKKPTVAVVESKRISLFRDSKKKKSPARKKKKQEQEFKLWYNGISVSIVKENAMEDEVYHLSIVDENNVYNCLLDECIEGFSKSVEKAVSFLSEYGDALQKSSDGVNNALEKLSQAFLEGPRALTNKEKEQMELKKEKDSDGLESMFEESFMENL